MGGDNGSERGRVLEKISIGVSFTSINTTTIALYMHNCGLGIISLCTLEQFKRGSGSGLCAIQKDSSVEFKYSSMRRRWD